MRFTNFIVIFHMVFFSFAHWRFVFSKILIQLKYAYAIVRSTWSSHRRNFVYDDGDLSPPLQKVVVTVTTTFSKWNLLPEAFCGLKYAENVIVTGAPPGPR